MPIISIELGPTTKDKKAQLIQTLTRDASDITGIPQEKFVVLIRELELDNIGVGGQLLSERLASSLTT
ncbi:MAG: tautomerase family protein [Desulfuromonadales bacterium]|nr:tautomerase family protein [Desulfuromonadales bacterium]